MFQVTQSDIAGRLSLLRYGLIVVVITTFVVSLLSQIRVYTGIPAEFAPGMGSYITTALIYTVVVGVISVAIYFGYSYLLNRGNSDASSQTATES